MTTSTAIRTTPWAALGQQFSAPVTSIKELRDAAGLNWEPAEEPQYRLRNGAYEQVPGYKYVTHSTTGNVIASTNSTFNLFSHADMLSVANTLLELAPRGITLEYQAGGPLYGGKRVWLCAQLGEPIFLPGDNSPYVNHLVLANNHDGHGSLKVLPVEHRIACANALHRAEMDAAGRMAAFVFRHTSGIDKRVADAKKALAATMAQFNRVQETGKELLGVKLTKAGRSEILAEHALRVVLRRDLKGIKTPADVKASPVALSAVDATVAELETLLGSATCAGIQNTAWGVYQAMVEHADHMRPTLSPDRYVVRTVLDRSPDKAEGFKVLQELHRR
jgi:phage/plasmid-like protein (TIGR03299 family)